MNTEPPEGDDLQRMLVSMKQHVLERATPHPTRRRFRPGIVLGVVGLLAVGTATGAVALTLAQQDRPVAAPVQTEQPQLPPSDTTPTSAPITGRPTPRPTPTPTPNTVATIPTDCRSTVPAADYDRLFGDTPVTRFDNAVSGAVDPATTPPNLSCEWREPGETGNRVLYVHVTTSSPEVAQRGIDEFGDESGIGTCSERPDGTLCQMHTTLDDGTDKAYTLYVRGDTSVVVDQMDFPTNGLLPAVIRQVWGD